MSVLSDEARAEMSARAEEAKARWAADRKAREEAKVTKEAKAVKEAKERAAAKEAATKAKAAARQAERERLERTRVRAAESDTTLNAAIDTLARIRAEAADRRRNAERRGAEAAEARLKIRRLEENLAAERKKLSVLEQAVREVLDDGKDDAEDAVWIAWSAHVDAWNALPARYVKKHRNRDVRKRMRGLNLDGG